MKPTLRYKPQLKLWECQYQNRYYYGIAPSQAYYKWQRDEETTRYGH